VQPSPQKHTKTTIIDLRTISEFISGVPERISKTQISDGDAASSTTGQLNSDCQVRDATEARA